MTSRAERHSSRTSTGAHHFLPSGLLQRCRDRFITTRIRQSEDTWVVSPWHRPILCFGCTMQWSIRSGTCGSSDIASTGTFVSAAMLLNGWARPECHRITVFKSIGRVTASQIKATGRYPANGVERYRRRSTVVVWAWCSRRFHRPPTLSRESFWQTMPCHLCPVAWTPQEQDCSTAA